MRVAVIGVGAVGARAARQLTGQADVDAVLVADRDPDRAASVAASLGPPARTVPAGTEPGDLAADVVVLAGPAGTHGPVARALLERDRHVVSVSDDAEEVAALLALDAEARERGCAVVVGAGFAPGFSCVLARHAAADFTDVTEVHVAKVGTAGPACARQHHRALGGTATDWDRGAWRRRRGGSGRELAWFPDPIGPEDCYRAALADPLLLVGAFPGVARVTARVGANRRDRLTARLPMLRRPHREGGPGAVRVEVRGRRGRATDLRILGAIDRPGLGAGAVAAAAARAAGADRLARPGAAGLAELVDPVPFLSELADRGVRAAVFEGV